MGAVKIKIKLHTSNTQWHRVDITKGKEDNKEEWDERKTETRQGRCEILLLYVWSMWCHDLISNGHGLPRLDGLTNRSLHGQSPGLAPLIACRYLQQSMFLAFPISWGHHCSLSFTLTSSCITLRDLDSAIHGLASWAFL